MKQEAGVTETRLQEMFPEADLILLEGFKYSSYPKMEILRQGNSETGICPKENLVAWVSDFLQDPELEAEQGIPLLDLNDSEQIAEYIIAFWYARTQMSMILLAGGLSSRMGSDKADLCWNGKTFLEHQIEKGKRLGITDIVVSGYREYGVIFRWLQIDMNKRGRWEEWNPVCDRLKTGVVWYLAWMYR